MLTFHTVGVNVSSNLELSIAQLIDQTFCNAESPNFLAQRCIYRLYGRLQDTRKEPLRLDGETLFDRWLGRHFEDTSSQTALQKRP